MKKLDVYQLELNRVREDASRVSQKFEDDDRE
jgi:hypothetical protein